MFNTFDASVTIYNHRYDAANDTDTWTRTQIAGVSWYGGQKTTVGDGGLNTADSYTVRIPANALPSGYIPADEYNTVADVSGKWTIQNGDVVVFGLIDEDITKAADITARYKSFVVTGVHDNRRGFASMRHIKIEGKSYG